MFLDEARLTAKLLHQNVVQVLDIGLDAGTYFFTMEFIEGDDLRQINRLRRQMRLRLPVGNALSIVIGAARGLHHAHEAVDEQGNPLNIVHRDVSCSNIVVSRDGCTKVIDFGVAQASGKESVTQAGMFKGKVGYMSPEQCRGGTIDRRADIYGLGVLLYELTTGSRLFGKSNDFSTLQRTIDGDIELPTQRCVGFPRALESIIIRCLAWDPVHRFSTAQELAENLDEYAKKNSLDCSELGLAKFMEELYFQREKLGQVGDVDPLQLRASSVSDLPLATPPSTRVISRKQTVTASAARKMRTGSPRLDTWIADELDSLQSKKKSAARKRGKKPAPEITPFKAITASSEARARKTRFARIALGAAALTFGLWMGVRGYKIGTANATLSDLPNGEDILSEVVVLPASLLAAPEDLAGPALDDSRAETASEGRKELSLDRTREKAAQSNSTKHSGKVASKKKKPRRNSSQRRGQKRLALDPVNKNLESEESAPLKVHPQEDSETKTPIEKNETPLPQIRPQERRASWDPHSATPPN